MTISRGSIASEATSATTAKFLEVIAPRLLLVEEELEKNFRSEIATINDVGQHILAGGGKRIRPALLLLSSSMIGYQGDADVRYAAVIELIHTATLVHDDVIDGADTRRGRSSVNYHWGNHLTVLVGDYLYTHAMKMAIREGRIEIVDLLCDATIHLTEGEILGLETKGRIDLTSDEYFDLIGRKTASLFAAGCQLPGHLVDLGPAELRALHDYGYNLGVCFQLTDDLLDYTQTANVIGKPVLADLREGKATLPLILALQDASEEDVGRVRRIAGENVFESGDERALLEMLERHRAIDRAREIAREYADRALGALESFPASVSREGLEFAVGYVLDRDR